MTRSTWHAALTVMALSMALFTTPPAQAADSRASDDAALAAAIGDATRSPADVARDAVRHPLQELAFFGLEPNQTVVELWPGGGYWTGILGPFLAARGHYYAALPPAGDTEGSSPWRARYLGHPDRYGRIMTTTLGEGNYDIAPASSADVVLTFRNLHNWMDGGYAREVLAACFRALKPGGILGIEEHRGRNDRPQDPKAASGYVRQDYAIELAKAVGFELAGSSEINANPRDTKDWPGGVWTLPPTLALGDKDRARYLAVGEADNFVLKFRKPFNKAAAVRP